MVCAMCALTAVYIAAIVQAGASVFTHSACALRYAVLNALIK